MVDIEDVFSENERYDVRFDKSRILRHSRSFINDSFMTSSRRETKINFVNAEDGSLSILLEGDGTEEELKKSVRIAEAICGYLASNERGVSVIVGIGSPYIEPGDIWRMSQTP